MVVFGQSDCIRAEVVVFLLKWLYSGKVDIFGQGGCIRTKVVVFGQNCCVRAKVVLFWQSGCIWEKVVILGHSGCIRAKWFYRAEWLISGKVIVFGQKWLYSC